VNGPNGPEVATGELIQTDTDCYGTKSTPNGKRDTKIREIGMRKLWRNRGKIENNPGGAGTPYAGVDHAPSVHETEGEVTPILPSLAGLTDTERYKHLIGALDDVQRSYEAARKSRDQFMVFARENGVSCHDIAIVLGITESGVRARIRQIKARAA
jgi:hypothetical protein